MSDLLARRLNIFKNKHSAIFDTGLSALLQKQAQDPNKTSGAKSQEITEFICDWLRKYFFGINIEKVFDLPGIIGIYSDYFSKYPEELSGDLLTKIVDDNKEEWGKKTSYLTISIRQRFCSDKTYIAELESLCSSVSWEGINELSNNLQQIHKDETRRQREIAFHKNEAQAERKVRIRSEIATFAIAALSMISSIATVIVSLGDTKVVGKISVESPLRIQDTLKVFSNNAYSLTPGNNRDDLQDSIINTIKLQIIKLTNDYSVK